MAIKDYSTEPDMNTTISGINIAEGCAPSGINNAIRQLMADVKEEFEGEEGAVSSLDSTLRALIAEEVAKCLKLSGGALTGALTGEQIATIGADVRSVFIGGANGLNENAPLLCFDGPNGDVPGRWYLLSSDGSKKAWLIGYPNGALELNGASVLTSAGGTMTGAIVNAILTRNNLSGQTEIHGGTNGSNGAYIALYGQSCTEGYGGGTLLLRAANKGTITDVTIDPGEGMYVGGKEVMCIASEWNDGNGNWYRKYSDGFIMQVGRTSKRPPIGNSQWAYQADFHIPFATTQYIVEHGATSFSNDASGAHATENIATTYCYIYEATYIRSGEARWFACGY